MNLKRYGAAAALIGMGILSGCSGGSGTGSSAASVTAVTGKVADGYLVNAQVFLDKNANYQLDLGEPNTSTDSGGAFTLNIDAGDAGKYPIVAVAIKDLTTDLDTNATVANTYVLSMHAVSVTATGSTGTSGTVKNFISPVSTLLRETLEANPGMSLADAMTKVRNQLDMPGDMNILGDYVFGSYSGSHKEKYRAMHETARNMAGLMGAQAGLVMNGMMPDVGRYRSMVGQMGQGLPQIAFSAQQGDTTMQNLRDAMHDALTAMPRNTFRNYSSFFTNMTSHRSFWNMSAGRMMPTRRNGMNGMM